MNEVSNWEEYVQYFSYYYKTTPHSSFKHQFSPFGIVYANPARKIGFLAEPKIDPNYNYDSFALEARYKIQKRQKLALAIVCGYIIQLNHI